MIERKRLLSLGYYKKAASFTGSDGNKNYKVEKVEDKEAGTKNLMATVWPGPFCFEKTAEEKKKTHLSEFSEEGLLELVDWMNETDVS